VLPYCASKPSYFYMLHQASEIATAFFEIATSISQLRISQ
jgi:hypothetical protein